MYEVAELEQAIACHATMYQKFPAKICGKRGTYIERRTVQYVVI